MESDNGRWYEHLLMPSVFRNLFVFMIVFGLIIGLVFPVFVHIMLGVDQALSVGFFAMCVMAGTLVGLVNFLLFDLIVSRHLSSIVLGMRSVLDRVASAETEGFQTSPFQLQITSADVIGDIEGFLLDAAARAEDAGVGRSQIVIDPGIGFGKSPEQNLLMLKSIPRFRKTGYPVLIGASRKSFLGHVTGREVTERAAGTAATTAWCAWNGADIVRVHDVREAVDIVKVIQAIRNA